MNSLYITYVLSYYFGIILSGGIIGGGIALIIAVFKKRFWTGFIIVLLCGFGGLVNPITSIIIGIMGTIFLCLSQNKTIESNAVNDSIHDINNNQICEKEKPSDITAIKSNIKEKSKMDRDLLILKEVDNV